MKKGQLQNPETYRIVQPASRDRPAATGTAKGTRVAFTKEDDDLLRIWVSRPENKVAGTSGNMIFKELAEKVTTSPESLTPWTLTY